PSLCLTHASTCASDAPSAMLLGSAFSTTTPAIQSATVRTAAATSEVRPFIACLLSIRRGGADPAARVEHETERGEREHERDARRDQKAAAHHAAVGAGVPSRPGT